MLTNQPQPIGLKEFIARVKQELLAEFDHDSPLFVIAEVDLEIAFTVERNMKGGIDFKVLQAGVDKTMTNVQTVTMKLEPIVTPDELRAGVNPKVKQKAANNLVRK